MAGRMKWPERHVSGRYIMPHTLVGKAFDGSGNILENHVQIVMEISAFEAHELVERLMTALNAVPGNTHHQLVMYLMTEREDDRRVPDELFMVNDLSDNPPDKSIWTREELQDDFPPGDPPAFHLERCTFKEGSWQFNDIDYKDEFGWEDYDE